VGELVFVALAVAEAAASWGGASAFFVRFGVRLRLGFSAAFFSASAFGGACVSSAATFFLAPPLRPDDLPPLGFACDSPSALLASFSAVRRPAVLALLTGRAALATSGSSPVGDASRSPCVARLLRWPPRFPVRRLAPVVLAGDDLVDFPPPPLSLDPARLDRDSIS
jgi:hypothetical protein